MTQSLSWETRGRGVRGWWPLERARRDFLLVSGGVAWCLRRAPLAQPSFAPLSSSPLHSHLVGRLFVAPRPGAQDVDPRRGVDVPHRHDVGQEAVRHAGPAVKKGGNDGGRDVEDAVGQELGGGQVDGQERVERGHHGRDARLRRAHDGRHFIPPRFALRQPKVARPRDAPLDKHFGCDRARDARVGQLVPAVQAGATLDLVDAEGALGRVDVDEREGEEARDRLQAVHVVGDVVLAGVDGGDRGLAYHDAVVEAGEVGRRKGGGVGGWVEVQRDTPSLPRFLSPLPSSLLFYRVERT